MDQQLRYNKGKAELVYVFSNQRALSSIRRWYGEEVYPSTASAHEVVSETLEGLMVFLDGGDRAVLGQAFVNSMSLVQHRVTPSAEPYFGDDWCQWLGSVPAALSALCELYVYGATKYERGNYRRGAPVTDYCNSALRHLVFGELAGEWVDGESGLWHCTHIAWNVLHALEQPERRDDRLPTYRLDAALSGAWASRELPAPTPGSPTRDAVSSASTTLST